MSHNTTAPFTQTSTTSAHAPAAAPPELIEPTELAESTDTLTTDTTTAPQITYGPGGTEISVDARKTSTERRAAVERRTVDIGSPTGLERRRGPGRRRSDDRRSAEEGEMTDEQFEFVLAIDTYKRLNNRPFPSWTEVLEVIRQLGYRKVMQSTLALNSPRLANKPHTPESTVPPPENFAG